VWNAAPDTVSNVLSSQTNISQPVRVKPPASLVKNNPRSRQLQTLAESDSKKNQH
jgi:putative proteasome-type protease